jgi:hypothetical protein
MLTAPILRSQLPSKLLSVLLIGMVLSACGRTAQSATQEATPNAVPTPVLPIPTQLAIVTLEGVIEQIAQESWRVDGTTILLDSQTAISGSPALGGSVRIRGILTGDGALHAQAITVNEIAQPTLAVASPTIAPTAAPTSTPLPQGAVVTINGTIQEVNITNNLTTIVVNNITYVVPHNVVVILGKQLRIGVPIIFVGQVDASGQIIIINVTHMNNRVIVINPPRREHDDEDDQGED